MNLKIAIMDEYSLALQGMYDYLKHVPNFEIIGAFTKAEELLSCLKQKTVDIVIVNLTTDDDSGIALLEKIHEEQDNKIKIVCLVTVHYNKFLYELGMKVGVRAYLPRDTSINELISAIICVGKGNDVVPDWLIKEQNNLSLTDMEMKVLKLVVQEYTNDQIAKELYISRRTVESHVSNICDKLGVSSKVGAAREAMRLKLI
jgi:two-component system vancomycin resistance associated response regulator VraR